MNMSICANCLLRLRTLSKFKLPSATTSGGTTSAFHTTARYAAAVQKKKGAPAVKKNRESTSAKIKRKHKERPRPPQPGERKALRKRIVLSNTNALQVQGMTDLTSQNMADAEQVGKFLGLEGSLLDQLRESKAFKTTQSWNMFRQPATLVREETVRLGQMFNEISERAGIEGQGPLTIREIITGEKSTGKSLCLLQAMSMAFLNKWVVINIPEAQDFTIGQSPYAPLGQPQDSQQQRQQQYIQPHLASALLSRAAYANEKTLSKFSVLHDHDLPGAPMTNKMSLRDLAMIGARDPTNAWPVWQAFWKELTEPASATQKLPPILIAIDGLDHWMGFSKYRSAEYELIHAHQLILVRQLLSMLFSQTPKSKSGDLTNGGMILAATTGSNSPSLPSFSLLLRQLVARAAGIPITDPAFPVPEPNRKIDQRVLDLLNGSERTAVRTLKGLSRHEARGLLEYYARSGILKDRITEALVGEKWSLSGGGVIGEMAKLGKRLRL